MTIFWTNPKSKISKYFTTREALYLPKWDKTYLPSHDEMKNIIKMAEAMDLVREFLQVPIQVHCWIRPKAYNIAVGGASASMHIVGSAVDWSVEGQSCDNIRKLILPQLSFWGVRMEDLPGSNWIHLDNKPCEKEHRFFKP
jgi:uncharacterized protein YcbK (DUF882 family)